jgi:hypothetical protein
MLITLTNDFHNTEVRIRVDRLPAALSERQTKRVIGALCGIPDCRCGIIRGPQEHDGRKLITGWEQTQQGEHNLHIWEED